MAGVLSFTLGLETSNFLRGIGLASGSIISLAGAMQGLNRVVEGTWGAIERGGALSDLSNRTGESVQTIYQLQEAFQVCGIASETVGPTLLRLQRSLAGVDEFGNKTGEVFDALGLSMGQLRGMDTAKRIETITTALSKLSNENAADLASRIFGREMAGNILQITRDFEGFKEALKETALAGQVFDRMAGAFDKIGDTITLIKSKVGGMWAGFAAGVVPSLQQLLDKVSKINFVQLGLDAGKFMGFFLKSFSDGTFGNVLSLSIQVGFEKSVHHAMRFAVTLGAAIMEVIPAAIQASLRVGLLALAGIGGGAKFAALEARRAFIQSDIDQMEKTKANSPGGVSADFEASLQSKRAALGEIQKEQEKVASVLDFAKRDVLENAVKDMANSLPAAIKAAQDAWKNYPAQPDSPAATELQKLLANFSAEWAKQFPPGANNGSSTDQPSVGGFASGGRPQASALEKMGFAMRGGLDSYSDYNRQIANNTARAVSRLDKLVDLNANKPGDLDKAFQNR